MHEDIFHLKILSYAVIWLFLMTMRSCRLPSLVYIVIVFFLDEIRQSSDCL